MTHWGGQTPNCLARAQSTGQAPEVLSHLQPIMWVPTSPSSWPALSLESLITPESTWGGGGGLLDLTSDPMQMAPLCTWPSLHIPPSGGVCLQEERKLAWETEHRLLQIPVQPFPSSVTLGGPLGLAQFLHL